MNWSVASRTVSSDGRAAEADGGAAEADGRAAEAVGGAAEADGRAAEGAIKSRAFCASSAFLAINLLRKLV
jgi:hypothetical protein